MSDDGTFLVSISGQIEWMDVLAPAGSSWHCKYEFVAGPDWKLIAGVEAGLSQLATVLTNGDKVILNFPLDLVFKTTNPFGWPQLVVSAYKGMQLEGYGRVHMPVRAGLTKLDMVLSKPQPSTFLGSFWSFFGYQPELLQPNMLATTAGNNLIRMVNEGSVHISINVLTQGFQCLGYDVTSTKD